MIQIHVFEYRFKNGEMKAVGEKWVFQPPSELPEWRYDDGSRVFVIFAYNKGQKKDDAVIEADFSPCIIKGWKIYHLEKVKLNEGGMINDRKASFSVKGLEKNERQRIDILVKGPMEKVKIEVK
ncbi:MAG TPA: hypothetical protein ENL29_01365 [Thermoplasmatales archaeon]|nr:hypothetical protein [Thermoplasmata archaeon]RLF44062.1 MAG: hypothetical protein DRN17_05180 [Thermoplasmata archaeon]HHH84098.1 hypothetical protein [Thermoplasmatales archaeon]